MFYLAAFFALPKPAQLATLAVALITRYLFNDWEFLGYLLVFVCLGGVTGLFADYMQGKLSRSAFGRFWRKVFIYAVMLMVAHGLTRFEIHGAVNWVFKTVDALIYTFLMGWEAVYILKNLTQIDPELLPPALRARLELAIMAVPAKLFDAFTAQPLTNPAEAPTMEPAPVKIQPDPAPVSTAAPTP